MLGFSCCLSDSFPFQDNTFAKMSPKVVHHMLLYYIYLRSTHKVLSIFLIETSDFFFLPLRITWVYTKSLSLRKIILHFKRYLCLLCIILYFFFFSFRSMSVPYVIFILNKNLRRNSMFKSKEPIQTKVKIKDWGTIYNSFEWI